MLGKHGRVGRQVVYCWSALGDASIALALYSSETGIGKEGGGVWWHSKGAERSIAQPTSTLRHQQVVRSPH
jgi:hypothetical protein